MDRRPGNHNNTGSWGVKEGDPKASGSEVVSLTKRHTQ